MSDIDVPTMIDVYALIDPRTDKPRYVGKSLSAENRLNQHLTDPSNDNMCEWISVLDEQMLKPKVEVLDTVPQEISDVVEYTYLDLYDEKYDILNEQYYILKNHRPFIDAIKQHGGQLAATSEIADTVGCSKKTARFRLNELHRDGMLTEKRELGNETIWEARDDV